MIEKIFIFLYIFSILKKAFILFFSSKYICLFLGQEKFGDLFIAERQRSLTQHIEDHELV